MAAYDWSDPSVLISIAQLRWTITATVVAAWFAIMYLRSLTPTMKLEVKSRPIPDLSCAIILELSIENVSKATIVKDTVLLKASREFPLQTEAAKTGDCLAREWVDFKSGAEEVFTSTKEVLSGERIHVERIYTLQPGDILKVGLQFKARPTRIVPSGKQWTTTLFVSGPPKS